MKGLKAGGCWDIANTCSLHFMISNSGLYMKWSMMLMLMLVLVLMLVAQVVSGGWWSFLEVEHLTDHTNNHFSPLQPISCSEAFQPIREQGVDQ